MEEQLRTFSFFKIFFLFFCNASQLVDESASPFRFGRKIVLFVTLAGQSLGAFLQVFSHSWVAFCILHFLTGMSHVSNYLAAFVLGRRR